MILRLVAKFISPSGTIADMDQDLKTMLYLNKQSSRLLKK